MLQADCAGQARGDGLLGGREGIDKKWKDFKGINNTKLTGLAIVDGVKYTIAYYSCILYLQICLLANIYL